MPEIYFHREAVTYEHADSVLSKLFSTTFEGLKLLSYESTNEPFTGTAEGRFVGNFNWFSRGAGFWNFINLIPRSKSPSSIFEINDKPKVYKALFLDIYPRVSYLLVSEADYEIVKTVVSSEFELGTEVKGIEEAKFAIYSVDTNASDLETGIAEEIVSSVSASRDILSVLGIQ